MHARLRRGELRALRANRVDLDAGLIRVELGWDDRAGEIATKSHNRRNVPIPSVLREQLLAQLVRSGRRGDELLFGQSERAPFDHRRMTDRAGEAWKGGEAQADHVPRVPAHLCELHDRPPG
jgi:integrase